MMRKSSPLELSAFLFLFFIPFSSETLPGESPVSGPTGPVKLTHALMASHQSEKHLIDSPNMGVVCEGSPCPLKNHQNLRGHSSFWGSGRQKLSVSRLRKGDATQPQSDRRRAEEAKNKEVPQNGNIVFLGGNSEKSALGEVLPVPSEKLPVSVESESLGKIVDSNNGTLYGVELVEPRNAIELGGAFQEDESLQRKGITGTGQVGRQQHVQAAPTSKPQGEIVEAPQGEIVEAPQGEIVESPQKPQGEIVESPQKPQGEIVESPQKPQGADLEAAAPSQLQGQNGVAQETQIEPQIKQTDIEKSGRVSPATAGQEIGAEGNERETGGLILLQNFNDEKVKFEQGSLGEVNVPGAGDSIEDLPVHITATSSAEDAENPPQGNSERRGPESVKSSLPDSGDSQQTGVREHPPARIAFESMAEDSEKLLLAQEHKDSEDKPEIGQRLQMPLPNLIIAEEMHGSSLSIAAAGFLALLAFGIIGVLCFVRCLSRNSDRESEGYSKVENGTQKVAAVSRHED